MRFAVLAYRVAIMSSSLLVLSLRRIAALLSVVLALVGGACDQRGGVATTKKGDLEKEEAEAARKAKEDQKIAEQALAAAAAEEPALNKGAKVTFLGYHKFTGAGTGTDMRIRMSEFRKQMQTLKDSGIAVISMSDFLAWRRGEKSIPQQSAIISIDDGYNSIYHLAFPVLKEFGYPFLIYIYTNYFGGGGKTLTATQIKEMIKAGAEVGSHSKSHPYDLRSRGGRSQEAYDKYLGEELVGSRKTLEEKLKIKGKVRTFAYPGGSYSLFHNVLCVSAIRTSRATNFDFHIFTLSLNNHIKQITDQKNTAAYNCDKYSNHSRLQHFAQNHHFRQ